MDKRGQEKLTVSTLLDSLYVSPARQSMLIKAHLAAMMVSVSNASRTLSAKSQAIVGRRH